MGRKLLDVRQQRDLVWYFQEADGAIGGLRASGLEPRVDGIIAAGIGDGALASVRRADGIERTRDQLLASEDGSTFWRSLRALYGTPRHDDPFVAFGNMRRQSESPVAARIDTELAANRRMAEVEEIVPKLAALARYSETVQKMAMEQAQGVERNRLLEAARMFAVTAGGSDAGRSLSCARVMGLDSKLNGHPVAMAPAFYDSTVAQVLERLGKKKNQSPTFLADVKRECWAMRAAAEAAWVSSEVRGRQAKREAYKATKRAWRQLEECHA